MEARSELDGTEPSDVPMEDKGFQSHLICLFFAERKANLIIVVHIGHDQVVM